MPEMLGFCGRRYRVRARAHKACDTIDWQQFRRMESAVHLEELRCDGSAHGGCQAGCLLYWKEAWLRPVDPQEGERTPETDAAGASTETLIGATQIGTNEAGQTLFSCQATELLRASKGLLPWWEPSQYVQDVTSGNSTVPRVIRALLVGLFNRFQRANARFLPRFCLVRGCKRYPFIEGKATSGSTPSGTTWPPAWRDGRDQEPRRDLRDPGRERHDARDFGLTGRCSGTAGGGRGCCVESRRSSMRRPDEC